ncbi:ABC-type Na+ transport system, ATPase component, partial [Mycoplasmoides gallisepticum]
MGLLSKDSGSIELFGEEVKGDFTRIRNNIGIVFQNSILDKNLSVYENLYSRLSLYKNEFKDKTTKQVVDEMVVNFKLEDIIW